MTKSPVTFIFLCITTQNIEMSLQPLNAFIDERLNKGTKQRSSSFFALRDQRVSLLLFRPPTVITTVLTHPDQISIYLSVFPFYRLLTQSDFAPTL